MSEDLSPLADLHTHRTTTMTVDELFSIAAPAYGDDWSSAIASLMEDPVERTTIEHLVSVLKSDKRFRSPVLVGPGARLGNGMHRVAAAAIVGAPLDVSSSWPELGQDEEYLSVQVTGLRKRAGTTGRKEGYDDEVDLAMAVTRSLPVPWGWAETDVMCFCSGVLEGIYGCAHRHAAALADEVASALAAWDLVAAMVSVGPANLDV